LNQQKTGQLKWDIFFICKYNDGSLFDSKRQKNWNNENKFYSYIQNLQDQIVAGLEAVDGQAKFKEMLGIVRWGEEEPVIENGAVFEKGGVNISTVHGNCQTACKSF
jgi:coproporphyrinogen III oxidase